jgi:hypothetical protein
VYEDCEWRVSSSKTMMMPDAVDVKNETIYDRKPSRTGTSDGFLFFSFKFVVSQTGDRFRTGWELYGFMMDAFFLSLFSH